MSVDIHVRFRHDLEELGIDINRCVSATLWQILKMPRKKRQS